MRDPWNAIRRAAADRTHGAAEVTLAAGRALRELSDRRDLVRAGRRLLRGHPEMASLVRLVAHALDGKRIDDFLQRVEDEPGHLGSAARWLITRRTTVLTHSASSSVVAVLKARRTKIRAVLCTESRPGGEGAALARRLRSEGFDARLVADAEMLGACAEADLVLVGADAVTEAVVVNKTGTALLVLAARTSAVPAYAVAGTTKLLPDVARRDTARFDATPIRELSGILTEHGVMSPAAVRRAAARITLPAEVLRMLPAP